MLKFLLIVAVVVVIFACIYYIFIYEKPKSIPQKTENEDYNNLLNHASELFAFKKQFVKLKSPLTTNTEPLIKSCVILTEICEYLHANQDKCSQISKLSNHILPTVNKQLETYYNLYQKQVKGEAIQKTLGEIEHIVDVFLKVLEDLHNQLHENIQADTSAELSVLRSLYELSDV